LATQVTWPYPPWFFLWGYVKDAVYVPPLPQDLPELRQRTATAIETIDVDMLSRVWQELDYRLDICRVTRGSHIESLWRKWNFESIPCHWCLTRSSIVNSYFILNS
jgi:hypothetical protein